MRVFKLRVVGCVSLFFVFLALTQPAWTAESWPVKRQIDLSNAFGEYRTNRFHAGVDIRTGATVGTRIYSPVDGCIWRIKLAYDGYGKALYIKGDNGNIYVFGHLQDFARKIDRIVKQAQLSSKRYYQDVYFEKDSIPIAHGEFVALSGRTGGTDPHLHFEVRSPENRPLNPLRHGFVLGDSSPPAFIRVIFSMVDDGSLFDNARRSLELNVAKRANGAVFSPDTVLYFNRPFGVFAECFDQTRPGGMHLNPYELALYIDDTLQYRVRFDTLDFEVQRSVNFEYDIARAAEGAKRVRRLYALPGNDYSGSSATNINGGVIGTAGMSFGAHKGKIVATDHAGNSSELRFHFIWGPRTCLYDADKIVVTEQKKVVHLPPAAGTEGFTFDSLVVLENRGGVWTKPLGVRVSRLEDGLVLAELDSTVTAGSILRLFLFADGCTIPDRFLIPPDSEPRIGAILGYEVLDDGLLVTVDTDADLAARPVIAFHQDDSLLGEVHPEFFGMRRYAAFVKPNASYSKIDRITCRFSQADTVPAAEQAVNIALVGLGESEAVDVGSDFGLRIGRSHLYEPRYIEFRRDDLPSRQVLIIPEAFACRADFEISYRGHADAISDFSGGICWWDKDDYEWIWLENVYKNNAVSAGVTGGGLYSLQTDREPPTISGLSIKDGLTYFNPSHPITFSLRDNLSGFADDRNIVIELDGEWMIPEYDPGTKLCQTAPLQPLSDGRHDLRIYVTDRAGNKAERLVHFFVKKQ